MQICLVALSFFLVLGFSSTDLPAQVYVKTPTLSFTYDFFVGVSNGRIFTKARNDSEANWTLLPPDGLPVVVSKREPVPKSVLEISCDGNDLMALSDANYIYFFRFSDEGGEFHKGWQGGFGRPVPTTLQLPEGSLAWAISQRGMENQYFTDIGGNRHPTNIGCDGLNILAKAARQGEAPALYLTDNWSIPNVTAFRIPLPARNRFMAEAFDVSAAQIFVIQDSGVMYTKLADYDIMGFDTLIYYSYENVTHAQPNSTQSDVNPYVLPTWPWQRQPLIPASLGKITSRVTVVQTGEGNDTRELRVEGVDSNGTPGYFTKTIRDSLWRFQQVNNASVSGPFLTNDGREVLGTDLDQNFTGPNLTAQFGFPVQLRLESFQPFESPATLRLSVDNNQSFAIPLHHHFTWPVSGRELFGALMLPASLLHSSSAHVQSVVKASFPLSAGPFHNASIVPLALYFDPASSSASSASSESEVREVRLFFESSKGVTTKWLFD